jgi:hypothetical protein
LGGHFYRREWSSWSLLYGKHSRRREGTVQWSFCCTLSPFLCSSLHWLWALAWLSVSSKQRRKKVKRHGMQMGRILMMKFFILFFQNNCNYAEL